MVMGEESDNNIRFFDFRNLIMRNEAAREAVRKTTKENNIKITA